MTRSPFLKAFGLMAAFVLAACLLCLAYWGVLHLRHRLQRHFAEMHDLLSEDGIEPLSPEEAERRDNAAPSLASALSWDVLGAATTEYVHDVATPRFTPEIEALDGQTESATGYMFPLSQSGEQTYFLLSPYPSSCPFCLPAGPSELIEVVPEAPVSFTYDPVTVQGRLNLLRKADDIGQGMYYRMTGASLRKP